MPFRWVRGRIKSQWLPRTASVVFTVGDLVIMTSGTVATATATSTTTYVGVIREGVASTDSDYATAAVRVLVEVPMDANAVLEGPVANGSLLTTSLGVKFGLTSAGAVDFADTTTTALMCVGFLSATLGHFMIEPDALWTGRKSSYSGD